jgi:hypothetical protein
MTGPDSPPKRTKPEPAEPDAATADKAFQGVYQENQGGEPTPDLSAAEEAVQQQLLDRGYIKYVATADGLDERCEWADEATVAVRRAYALLIDRGYSSECAFGHDDPTAWPVLPPVAGLDVHDAALKTAMQKVILSQYSRCGWDDSGIEFADDVVLSA